LVLPCIARFEEVPLCRCRKAERVSTNAGLAITPRGYQIEIHYGRGHMSWRLERKHRLPIPISQLQLQLHNSRY
jgi:hypothetical protein